MYQLTERYDDIEQAINNSDLSDELKAILIQLLDYINAK